MGLELRQICDTCKYGRLDTCKKDGVITVCSLTGGKVDAKDTCVEWDMPHWFLDEMLNGNE